MKRRKILSFAMALVMCISMCMPGLTAYAADPGDTPPAEPVTCTCDDKCTKDNTNPDCTVCNTDLTQCKGTEKAPEPMPLVQLRTSVGSYADLKAAISNATESQETEILLSDNIVVTDTIEIPSNKVITLNLGGHTVSYTGSGHVSIFTVKGTLTLIGDGTITGGTGNNKPDPYVYKGGGVYVDTDAVFNMGTKDGTCNVKITGNKAPQIDGNGSFGGGVYVNLNATFNMYSGTISDNYVNRGGAGVYVNSDAIFNMYGGSICQNKVDESNSSDGGAGVYLTSGAVFNMEDGTISKNEANNGGGVYINSRSSDTSFTIFTMKGGSISGNLCRKNVEAAAVYVKGKNAKFVMNYGLIEENIAQFGTNNGCAVKVDMGGYFELNGGTISNNKGNGVSVTTYNWNTPFVYSSFTMNDGTITGNETTTTSGATHAGGAGVLVEDGCTFTMNGGAITGNTAFSYGGGIYIVDATFVMNDGDITENTATNEGGGGVCVSNGATMEMFGGSITENNAQYGGGVYINSSSEFTRTDGMLCNNTAKQYGDDIALRSLYSNDLTLGAVGSNWTVDGCEHAVDGWYRDGKWKTSSGSDGVIPRWHASVNLDNNATRPCGSAATESTEVVPGNFRPNKQYGEYGIKAAHGNLNYYTVTFDYNDNGTTHDSKETVLANTLVSKPKDPERAGYTFLGWYSESIEYKFDTPVNSTLVLSAKWEELKPTLSYDLSGGTGGKDADYTPRKHSMNEQVPTQPAPEKEGYTFVEWNTTTDGTGTSYQPGDTIILTQDTTLYAQWTPNITIGPANIIAYIGGSSYNGVVNEDGDIVSSNGFPEPGFVLSLPKELTDIDVQQLYLQYEESDSTILKWKFVKYGEGNHNVYRIEPADGTSQRDVRIEFINAAGERVTSDSFNTKDYLNQSLRIEIYGEGIEAGKVFFAYQGKEYGITVQPATLTVRGTTSDVEYAKVLSDAESIDEGEPGLVANAGTTYTINDSDVHVDDASGISLLFDEIINDQGTDRTDLLKARTDRELGTNGNNRYYDFKYLDLVDQNNGNTWVKADQNITVYWPLPEGTNANTQFKLLHFADAHRSLSNDQIQTAIQTGEVETMKIKQVTDTHVIFDVVPGGFSPFALVWETKSSSTVDPGPDTDPTPTEHTLRYDTNGGEKLQSETKKISWTKDYEDLPTPQRDGYTFAGWYRNSALTMPITGDIKVYGTVTIYAKWNKTVVDPDDTGVSDLLNTQDHKEYLHGYDTGLFGPNNDMTRAEAAQMFYNLLLDKDVPITVNFSDVPADAWYATAVNTLASLGLVEGVGNNEFAPDRAITRAEFTVIAMRFTNGEVSGENIFSDISANDWFYDQVVGSIQYGWITGYEDGTFRPNTTIARAEVTTIVNRMLGRSADVDYVDRHKDDLRLFPDVSQDYWAYYQIVEATNAHDYTKEGNTESWSKLK